MLFLTLMAASFAADLHIQPTFNAGVQLACGEDRVFLDTFFTGLRHYQAPSSAERE